MKNLVFLVGLILSLPGLGSAAELKDKEAAMQLVQSVMQEIGKGEIEKGIQLTKPYLIIPDHEYDGMLNATRMQQPIMDQRFGKTVGTELAVVEEVGESLMLVTYVQKFDKHLIRWKFYFYKPKDGWVLNTFTFDDKIQLMFRNI